MTLSVIIPCYNNGMYLKGMIDCCLNQTYKDWELIIVDDLSTDGTTQQIAKDYCDKDPRIRFYVRDRQPKGSVVCRNIGFTHSSGEYIIHFDADDLISDTCFEDRVKFMDENLDCDYASFPAKPFTVGRKFPPTLTSPGKTFGVPISGDLLKDFLSTDYSFSVWCNIYRRSSILDMPWDENVCIYTDFGYIVPGILAGLKHMFSGTDKVDYYYRENYTKTNMCASYSTDAKCKSTIYLFGKTMRSLADLGLFEEYKETFSHFIVLHFDRLVMERDNSKTEEYLNLIRQYYSADFMQKITSVYNKCKMIHSQSKIRLALDYLLYFNFHFKIYRIQAEHNTVKYLLGKLKYE